MISPPPVREKISVDKNGSFLFPLSWLKWFTSISAGVGISGFIEFAQTITNAYRITAGNNALSVAPIIINDGITVTIPDGSVWAII